MLCKETWIVKLVLDERLVGTRNITNGSKVYCRRYKTVHGKLFISIFHFQKNGLNLD